MLEMLAITMVVIILQYIDILDEHVVHLKFKQYVNYISRKMTKNALKKN